MSTFVRANSTNLPEVNLMMLLEFMKTSDKHNVAEIRGVKALMSSRDSYLESAVGYVELKRAGSQCLVRAKIVPEHKISSKYYVASVHIKDDTIEDASCDGCAAAAGGCKYTLVLLYWLHKRSAEPSPTSVKCYWQKPSLSSARHETVESKDVYSGNSGATSIAPRNKSVLEEFRAEAVKRRCTDSLLLSFDTDIKSKKLSKYCVFDTMVEFLEVESDHSYENFKKYIDQKIEPVKGHIAEATLNQVSSKLWHCMRQARITGSKIYEIAHCQTSDGSLVQELLGGYKFAETKSMKRGKLLEKQILKQVSEEMGIEVNEAGLHLINGIFGASPDGIANDFVLEIKCPISTKTQKNYISNGQITSKYMGQVQLEMLATGKTRCLFCVADPKYEQNAKIEKVFINFDINYITDIMSEAEIFWKKFIYPKVLASALC